MENKEIKLNDLLSFEESDFKNIKIRFSLNNGYIDPINEYVENPEKVKTDWLFWRERKRLFHVGQIAIGFVQFANQDRWLLTTIKKVTKELNNLESVNYEGEELEEYKQYFGRVIVKYHKTIQQGGLYYENICNDLEVQQILPSIYDIDEAYSFPGYDKVKLSYNQLLLILNRSKRDWISALENQKAVYLITDKSNGKLYVGSATRDNGMLLQRWRSYIANGHGGNTELIKLVNEKGFEYIKENFQYSILENYNAKIDDNVILKRELWWKEILQTRKFGYNDN